MEYYNNTLTIEASWLIDEGIVKENNYKRLTQRKQLNVVRRGCRNNTALIAYDSMPERFKRKVCEKVGDPYKVVSVNQVQERISESNAASEFFDGYTLSDGRFLPAPTRREYYANAIILDAIHQLIISRRAKRSALGGKNNRFWDKIAEATQEIDRTRYPHTLPSNARSLERKYKLYKSEGYVSLIHKTFINGNKNAAKVADNHQESMLAMLISDSRNFDNAQIMRLYNLMAEQMQWQKISSSTVAVWRDKLDNVLFARRRGVSAFRNEKAMQAKRYAPTYPLYFWTMDGWDVELMYQKVENGRTTYHHRPTVVVVLDACCKYPVGYAIGTHETPELIQEALRNAAKHTESLLGQMYRTNQLQSDRYAIKKMTHTYEVMADKVTPAQAHNAKAKIIEPWFHYINKKYCQIEKNWSGFGITSQKNLQPNGDFLNKFRHQFPDFEGVCKQVIAFMEHERAELQEQYVNLFNQMPNEHKIPLSYDQYLLQFGSNTGNKNLLQGSGLKISIGGIKRDYDCFDDNFRCYASTRWSIRFDPDDLSKVLAVNDDETLRFVLEEKYRQPMALIERKEGDYEQLQRIVDFNNRQQERIISAISNYDETTRELIEGTKAVETETLHKLLICDSKGQHKDRRNDNRSSLTTKSIAEAVFSEEDLLDEY